MGFILNNKNSVFNPYTSLSIGSGASKKLDYLNKKDFIKFERNYFDLIELNLGLQIKITKWFRLTPTIGYRYITYEDTPMGLKNGIFYNVNFQFGFISKSDIEKYQR
jgi:hypothetical protein